MSTGEIDNTTEIVDTQTVEKTEITTPPPQPGTAQPTQAEIIAELERVKVALKEANKESAARRKRLEELEAQEKQRQDAQLSETEKLQKALAEKEATLKQLTLASWQREAAEKVGLPTAFAARLKGETPEDLEVDAKALLEALPKASQPKVGTTNPGASATGNGETADQRLARIHGRGLDMFDSATIAKLGGGVKVVSSSPEE